MFALVLLIMFKHPFIPRSHRTVYLVQRMHLIFFNFNLCGIVFNSFNNDFGSEKWLQFNWLKCLILTWCIVSVSHHHCEVLFMGYIDIC